MGIAIVTRNYQVTIPKDVRTLHDIKIGDTVLFALEGEKIDFMKLKFEDAVKSVAGLLKIKDTGIEYTKEIRSEWKKREAKNKL